MSIEWRPSAGFTFFQVIPASAIDDALTPVQQAFFALRIRICLEQFKWLYIAPCPLIIFLDFSLHGL